MTIGIYKIECTKNNKVYIGSSSNIERRQAEHTRYLKSNKHINPYLQNSYNKYGLDNFVFSVLEECSVDNLLEREQFYLDLIFESGNTFNIALMAGKPKKNRRMPHTEEAKHNMSLAQKGKKKSKDHKSKISTAKKGTIVSEETRQKMSIAAKNRKKEVSQETRDKLSKINKNKIVSEETKLKMSLAQKNRIRSPHTEETKRKMSEAQKNRKVQK